MCETLRACSHQCIPSEVSPDTTIFGHLSLLSIGCMQEASINGAPVVPSESLVSQGVTEGCAMLDQPNPCIDIECRHGTCHPLNDYSYRCDCQDGWMGDLCEQRKLPSGAILDGGTRG